ncbi:MAG: hypothetical protein OXQ28_06515 [Acidobacteriota bacterium]|nr:hypothetical protein [Acidobacteriota bacterium]
MIAHYHGQVWKAAEFARALGERFWIVYPGDEAHSLDERVSVLPVAGVPELAASLG